MNKDTNTAHKSNPKIDPPKEHATTFKPSSNMTTKSSEITKLLNLI